MPPLEPVDRIRDAHLKDYYRTLRKHRWLVCGLFLAAVLTVGIYSFVQTPIYQATATVLIRPVSLTEIERTARERLLMPPKSTFFTPKLRTGLVIRTMDA